MLFCYHVTKFNSFWAQASYLMMKKNYALWEVKVLDYMKLNWTIEVFSSLFMVLRSIGSFESTFLNRFTPSKLIMPLECRRWGGFTGRENERE